MNDCAQAILVRKVLQDNKLLVFARLWVLVIINVVLRKLREWWKGLYSEVSSYVSKMKPIEVSEVGGDKLHHRRDH